MDRDQDQDELEQLFLGVLAPFTRGPEAEPLPLAKGHNASACHHLPA
jgi:hypothetical protein